MIGPNDDARQAWLGGYAVLGVFLAVIVIGTLFRPEPPGPARSPRASLRPDHLTMIVPDIEETMRWYEEKLGFVQVATFVPDNQVAHTVMVRDSNLMELIDGEGSSGPVRASHQGFPAITVGRVPILLDDVDGEISSLREQGVEVISDPRDAHRRPLRIGVIRDVNGRLIELQQPL